LKIREESDAEIHILQGRMHEALLNKARRGDLYILAPVGYVKLPVGGLALDPDEQAGRRGTGRRTVTPEQYHAWIPGHCPAYITRERYERNQRMIQGNRILASSKGPAREGLALLGGYRAMYPNRGCFWKFLHVQKSILIQAIVQILNRKRIKPTSPLALAALWELMGKSSRRYFVCRQAS
jgi:hypothetical protein